MPKTRRGLLRVVMHLLRYFARLENKDVPGLSEDAARFLAGRPWALTELATVTLRAVASNRGSLITSGDLDGS